jgi:hypothetical protein
MAQAVSETRFPLPNIDALLSAHVRQGVGAALAETRASVTPEMLEEYDRIQETLKSEATRPMGGIGFVLPGMLHPKGGGKS